MVETLQLFPLCLWTMLQRVKVGHICTLSNGHFYSKGPPDIFSTLFVYFTLEGTLFNILVTEDETIKKYLLWEQIC